MRNDDRGTILIEFIGSFLLFFLLIISILSLVNIVTAQARVHYALTETANTMSMYGYVMSAAKTAQYVAGQDTTQAMREINEALEKLNNFRRGIPGWRQWKDSAPAKAMQAASSLSYSAAELSSLRGQVEQLIYNNLSAGSQSGQDYLISARITSLKLTDFAPQRAPTHGKLSSYINDQYNIKLTVEYEIDYSFMGLPLPFEPKLRVAQSVMTKVWYQKDGYRG